MICEGVVLHGKKLARIFGFPTININNVLDLEPGVYAGYVFFEGIKLESIIYVGIKRPKILEAHIFDFNIEIYGKSVMVEILKKIREDKKDINFDQIKININKDINEVKKFFS